MLLSCAKCSKKVSSYAASCPHCNATQSEFSIQFEPCSECGAKIETTASQCRSCGAPAAIALLNKQNETFDGSTPERQQFEARRIAYLNEASAENPIVKPKINNYFFPLIAGVFCLIDFFTRAAFLSNSDDVASHFIVRPVWYIFIIGFAFFANWIWMKFSR